MAHNCTPLQPVVLRLSASDREAVRALARRRRCPESVILREAVSSFIQRHAAEAAQSVRPPLEAAQFPGEWVALSGQKVIAHGTDGVAVFREARRLGELVPRMFRVPSVASDEAFLGL